jgi:hypothetical protein
MDTLLSVLRAMAILLGCLGIFLGGFAIGCQVGSKEAEHKALKRAGEKTLRKT